MKQITAIGFDLFNTLITVEASALDEAVQRLIDSLRSDGVPVDSDRFRELHRDIAVQHVLQARQDGRETHNRFWISQTLQQLGQHVQPEDIRIAKAVEAYFSSFLEHSAIIPETTAMLQRLKGSYRLGLLSNFTHAPAARSILDNLELTACFDTLLISGELGYRKPHPRVFSALAASLETEPGQILYVGDDPRSDVAGAWQNGLTPVWMTYVRDRDIPQAPGLASLQQEDPEHDCRRISDWKDLLELLDSSG
jgi:putative hydrolase of the HAD superfamily